LAFTDAVEGVGQVAYFDTHGLLPGMLELIEVNAVLEAMFNEMREAARDWMAAIPFVKCQQEIDCDRNA
jgi:hypothetical protein